MSLQISDLLNMASISIDANPACWIYVFLTAACDRFDTIHTRFSANCFLGLYLTVCKRTIPSYLVIFQVTGKCLNLYLSRRKRPNSTKDKRKVSNPSFTVDFFSPLLPSPSPVPLTVTGACGGNSAAFWLVTWCVCPEHIWALVSHCRMFFPVDFDG